jgi:cephalosporin hydroxylase
MMNSRLTKMSFPSRVWKTLKGTYRFCGAYYGIPELNRRADSLLDAPGQLTSLTFGYQGGFLRPIQIEEELARLLRDVRGLRPITVLEIGTCHGGTLYLWTRLAQPDAMIISIDMPGGKFGGGYSSRHAAMYRRFARDKQTLKLIRADSHAPSTREEVDRVLMGRKVDFLFIDGDHTYDGVKMDWMMYSPLVRAGGIIAFHDVAGDYGDTQVKKFWDSIKNYYVTREYMEDAKGQYGIGVVIK